MYVAAAAIVNSRVDLVRNNFTNSSKISDTTCRRGVGAAPVRMAGGGEVAAGAAWLPPVTPPPVIADQSCLRVWGLGFGVWGLGFRG